MLQITKKAWLFDLAQTLLHSWWTFVAAACFGLAGGIVALQYSPKLYQATTTVWMSQPQLDDSVAESPVKEDLTRRLMAFTEADLGHSYMLELVERTFGLPETEEELRRLTRVLRARIGVSIMGSRRRGITTFALTYRGDTDPQRTANVVNTLTDLYIAQNEDFRAGRAEKTADTIFSLAENVKPDLDKIEQELIEFIRVHRFETKVDLPENQRLLDAALREIDLMETRRAALEAKRQGLQAQIEAEKIRAANAAKGTPGSPRTSIDPVTVRLADLQRELDEMRIHYSELHPSYIKKKRELEDLLAKVRTMDPEEVKSGVVLDPAVAALQAQLEALDLEAQALDVEEARHNKNIAEYRRRISIQPEVQQQLDDLTSRRSHLRDKYQKLLTQAENARGSVNLEEEQMLGRQMEVLERASVPTAPYAPDPLRFYAMGLAVGCLLFVGPLLARSLLNPVILSQEGFRALSDHPLLVSIPNLHNDSGFIPRRFLKNVAFSVIASAVLVATKLILSMNA